MRIRLTLTSAVVIAAPVVLALLIGLLLARPSTSSPDQPPNPTVAAKDSASGQQNTAKPAGANMAPPPATTPARASAVAAEPQPPAALPAAAAATPGPSGPIAPDFDGGGAWINSEPLTLAELTKQGNVVLVDFWTYGCYNCKNTLPYVKQWWEKYRDQGLVIVGVHTPEFDHERALENVQEAVEREGIGWPVVQDNDYTIWRAYGNRYWPRFYLVGHHGRIVYDRIGEGAYDETERRIAAALAAAEQQ
jgi:thiol-disulfide isomerase/thioredoxin